MCLEEVGLYHHTATKYQILGAFFDRKNYSHHPFATCPNDHFLTFLLDTCFYLHLIDARSALRLNLVPNSAFEANVGWEFRSNISFCSPTFYC